MKCGRDPWRTYRKPGMNPHVLGILAMFAIIVAVWIGCCIASCAASTMALNEGQARGAGVANPPVPPPTSQPVANVATQGQLAASIVSQLRSELDVALTGIAYNRTVDHALGGGQVVVLLAALWIVRAQSKQNARQAERNDAQAHRSHEREMARIKRNGGVR